jgi:hypothetical protein
VSISGVSHPITPWSSSVTALDMLAHVLQLEEELAAARREGLEGNGTYMADLHAELDHRRELYITAAVTEIATLRAELFGPQLG